MGGKGGGGGKSGSSGAPSGGQGGYGGSKGGSGKGTSGGARSGGRGKQPNAGLLNTKGESGTNKSRKYPLVINHSKQKMGNKTQKINKELAIIHWEDSWTHGNVQLSEKEWEKKSIGYVISAGLVVNEDDKQISLATDYFYPQSVDEGSFRVVNSFPKSCIHKIIKIKLPAEIIKEAKKYYIDPKEMPKKKTERRIPNSD